MTNKFLLARKKGMTQIFHEDGNVVPVTVLEVGPCTVTGIRDKKRDGYRAVQLGFIPARAKHVNKPQLVAAEKTGVKPFRVLREFRVEATDSYEIGQELTAETFEIGDVIDVSGKSKGRGFAGTIKAHGFSRGNETHGCHNVRQPGSIGQCASPSRVFKGQRMPKHFGNSRCTVKNLTVEGIDADRGLLLVRGGVPGAPNSLVQIQTAKTGGKK
jgi:large subunit ribosomal protein L3